MGERNGFTNEGKVGNKGAARSRAPSSARQAAKAAVQVLGFAIGVGLLAWCLSVALSAKNREQFEKLGEARWSDVATLVVLSLATVVINGTIFWVTIRPVRRLAWARVVSVNAIATALAYLPFKLSVVARYLLHVRQDRLPVLTVTTWLGNVGSVMAAVLGPVVIASAWRGRMDGVWLTVAAGGAAAACLFIIIAARFLSHERVWTRVVRFIMGDEIGGSGGIARGRLRRAMVRANIVEKAHEGIRMLSHPGAVAAAAGMRIVDLGVLSARFLIAARITGQDLPLDQAILAASVYFVIGVVAPTGQLGFREAGVFALVRSESFAVVVLTVTAVEMATVVIAGTASAAAIRADRVLLVRRLRDPSPETRPRGAADI